MRGAQEDLHLGLVIIKSFGAYMTGLSFLSSSENLEPQSFGETK